MSDGLLGRLTWNSVEPFEVFRDPSFSTIVGSSAAWLVVIGAVVVLTVLTVMRWWGPLFRDWIFSTDHKKIGIMYIVIALVMFARGVAEGFVMRAHQATAYQGGFLAPEHWSELFSTHGTIMIFFVAMPLIIGFMNFLIPLQIGARDMAFPVLNQASLGFTFVGAALLMASLVLGGFQTGGWSAYPPYTGAAFQPGPGPDYWIWAIVISGVGSLLSGLNFAVTIYKMRCPGMSFMRMPVFCWTALCTSILLVFAMPPLTVAALMQALDRYLDFHFFTNDLGGNMMLYANLFWLFGHPEVYILVLPAYGIYSELTATFSGKTIYGYTSLVLATMAISVLAFTVWLHHFFTMGQSATINIAFGIATMLIAIPTGVKVYVWIATLWRGRIRFRTPLVYLSGFLTLFLIGGYSGIILANPTINFSVHNTQFIVAHFHNVILPGVLFAILAGIYIWFPKAFGFRLDERWSTATAWLWIVGFCLTFLPLYIVGMMGYPRRSAAFEDPAYIPYVIVCFIGAITILTALCAVVGTFVVSIRNRAQLAVPVGDPWDGRTLEWATPAPVPEWNFAVIPEVSSRDPFTVMKRRGDAYTPPKKYEDIALSPTSPLGLIVAVFGTTLGLALTFWIWWLAILSVLVLGAAAIGLGFVGEKRVVVPAAEVEREHARWLALARQVPVVPRELETSEQNRGLADSVRAIPA